MSQSHPWKILYLIWSLDLGGAEQVVLHLARGLDRSRFQPIIGCLIRPGVFAAAADEAGIPMRDFQKRSRFDLTVISRLSRFVRKERIDLIHAHLFTANFWGRLTAAFTRTPVVVTEHSVDTWKGWPLILLDKGLKGLTTHWVFVSPQVRQFYERHLGPLARAWVIPNGIPIPQEARSGVTSLSDRKGAVTLATVGRLVPEKQQVRFVELVGSLYKEGLPVKGLIIGEGPERPKLEQAIAAQGLKGVVELVGFVSQMKTYWPRVDIFCLTSSREGLPLTLLEAMGYGIPVLSTAVGGVAECVQGGVEGILVPFGDWEGFLQQTRRLVQDPQRRATLGAAGRARVKREFSVERMVLRHQALYADLLEKPKRPIDWGVS